MKTRKEKKIKVLNFIVYIVIGVCFAYNILFLLNTTITQNDYFQLFGITLLNMENNLMENDISQNELVVIKSVEEKELQEGDIIAYTVNGQTRINKIINTKNGYTTKSNKNYYPDIEKLSYDDIIGKKVGNITFWGSVIKILQSRITSLFVLIILLLCFINNKYMNTKREERARKKKIFKGKER